MNCESVCNVTVILPSIVRCDINETLNCRVNVPQIKNKDNHFSPSITYWILDYQQDYSGKFIPCIEIDQDSKVITSGTNTGEHNTHSFKCEMNIIGGSRSVIMKIKSGLLIDQLLFEVFGNKSSYLGN